ncbi:MAG: N-acetylgalactosamine 6-sulfate sulfatase, partial [Planctomycetes bacterium]|nr:N-acetylgalactosamine 6-sulfate sulfatase [Planctomycetota bacterium]
EYKRWADDMPLTSNYPLRGGKATVFEGGTREPMFVVWPGTVQPGSKCTEVVSSVDFYPTILEMVGLKPKSGQILDGESIMPLLKQTGKLKREAIFCHFPHSMGQRSPAATWVRKGDWKLIRVYDTAEPFTEPYHLYNLKDDLSETNNLAAKMPEKVKELDALIDKFLKDTGAVVPIPNPKYDPKAAALGGWVDKTDSADVQNGILKLQLASPGAFIATASLQHAGEAIFRLRLRSLAGGPGKMTWRTADQKEFVEVQVVPFDLPGDGQWHEVSVKVPAKGTLVHVRLYPASKPGAVEIDWIRLCQADGTELKVWDFGK